MEIDEEEVEHSLQGMKNNKAPLKDGILTEILKELGRELTVLMNKGLVDGHIPKEWNDAVCILFHYYLFKKVNKIGKVQATHIVSQRYKLLTQIVTKRLTSWISISQASKKMIMGRTQCT